jgi:hypothetical protein
MSKKKYTAEQLRIAREIVDQEEAIQTERSRRGKVKRKAAVKQAWTSDRLGVIGVAAIVMAVVIWIFPWGTCYRPTEWPDGCWSVFNDNGSYYIDEYGWFNSSRLNYSLVAGFLGALAFVPRALRSLNR